MKYRDGAQPTENELMNMARAVICFAMQEIIDRQDEGDLLDLDVDALERFLLVMFADHLARTAAGGSAACGGTTTISTLIH